MKTAPRRALDPAHHLGAGRSHRGHPIWRQCASRRRACDALDEVVVTARYRTEKLQDVPQNIDVFASQDIRNLGIEKLEDYLTMSPSIAFISIGPGQQRIFMRGVSDGSNPNYGHSNLSTTGYLIDDLSFNYHGHIPDLQVYDVERIEVLNGPQGTSFGPGALSGAVRIVTKKPDPNGFSASADVTAARSMAAPITGPMKVTSICRWLRASRHCEYPPTACRTAVISITYWRRAIG